MGEIGRAMLKVGLVSEGQLKQAEKEAAEEIINKWRRKYGDSSVSKLLFVAAYLRGGETAVKEMLEK